MKLSDILGEAAKPSAGLTKGERSRIAKKARRGEKFAKNSESSFKNISAGAAKKYGSKESGDRVAGAVFWKARKGK